MLALMANMYFVIDFCLKYRAWKANWKAVVSSFIIWFSGTLIVVLFSIPLLCIDLGDVQVIEYRAKIYQQGKYYIAAFMALFTICSGILGFLTINAIKRKKMKVSEMSPGLQKKHLILDVKRKENCLSFKKNRLIYIFFEELLKKFP